MAVLIKTLKYLVVLTIPLLPLTGCKSWDFDPYDYEKHEDAKVKNEKADCEIKLKNKRPCIEWTWPLQK